ncbi:MAG: DUF1624 domain-containing protein [Gammaproteobacteria bacterium]|nr:DUF1624 domain-containing protein [Gammaproteobacteria bacterium]
MPPNTRLQSVDLLRGLAIALMIGYHFSYDLAYFGFAQFDFYRDPFWRHTRTLILSSFLLVSGISLTLATRSGIRWKPYLRRLAYLVGCALLISLTSWLMFGPRWIFFGVLHFIAVAGVIGLPFVRAPALALATGIALLLLGNRFAHPFFDQPALQWVGLMTYKPPTEDYVPLLPWFGVVLVGIFLGDRCWLRQPPARLTRWRSNRLPVRLLAVAGRHSLLIYMLHQPLLIGALWLLKRALG